MFQFPFNIPNDNIPRVPYIELGGRETKRLISYGPYTIFMLFHDDTLSEGDDWKSTALC